LKIPEVKIVTTPRGETKGGGGKGDREKTGEKKKKIRAREGTTENSKDGNRQLIMTGQDFRKGTDGKIQSPSKYTAKEGDWPSGRVFGHRARAMRNVRRGDSAGKSGRNRERGGRGGPGNTVTDE